MAAAMAAGSAAARAMEATAAETAAATRVAAGSAAARATGEGGGSDERGRRRRGSYGEADAPTSACADASAQRCVIIGARSSHNPAHLSAWGRWRRGRLVAAKVTAKVVATAVAAKVVAPRQTGASARAYERTHRLLSTWRRVAGAGSSRLCGDLGFRRYSTRANSRRPSRRITLARPAAVSTRSGPRWACPAVIPWWEACGADDVCLTVTLPRRGVRGVPSGDMGRDALDRP